MVFILFSNITFVVIVWYLSSINVVKPFLLVILMVWNTLERVPSQK